MRWWLITLKKFIIERAVELEVELNFMKFVLLAKAFFKVDIFHKLYSEDLKDARYKFCKLMDSDDE